MRRSITLKAPAKINLFLDVLGKRSDGYHNIITVFERINIFDRITLSTQKSGVSLSCNKEIPEKNNQAYKAAHLILSESKAKQGIKIRIEKNIPIAAGLGGGSSDAASTLIGINILLKLGYNKDRLISLAKSIGADVAFFILEESFAIGKEKGDAVESLPFKPPKMWHLIVFPGVRTFTKEIYEALRLDLTTKRPDVKILIHALRIGDFDLIKETAYNRLEDPALDREPGLNTIRSNLIRLDIGSAHLSGSGSTIFSIAKTRKEAISAKKKALRGSIGLRSEEARILIAHTW